MFISENKKPGGGGRRASVWKLQRLNERDIYMSNGFFPFIFCGCYSHESTCKTFHFNDVVVMQFFLPPNFRLIRNLTQHGKDRGKCGAWRKFGPPPTGSDFI